jgi:peroxiredoxin
VQIPSYEADLERFEEANAQVLGISVDSTFTNSEWAKSLGVENVPLLSDFFPHGEVAQAYGVLGDAGYAERVIFIIDQEGVIRYIDVNEIDELPDNEVIFEELAKLR